MNKQRDELIVLAGPTAVGKTSYAIAKAKELGCEIISADSRQVYREMQIGTAAPTEAEMEGVPHHMVRNRSIESPMNAWDFEQTVMGLLPEAFERGRGKAILVGGSMMYVDAVCRGIDDMPTISETTRQEVKQQMAEKGLSHMQEWLRRLDPEYHQLISERGEQSNPRRILHAIEICLESGQTCTSMRIGQGKERPFLITKAALVRDRAELYERIDRRVDQMMEMGLEAEVRSLSHLRNAGLSSLNTVGYREIFDHMDGKYDLEECIRLIKRNTRHYAKKQMTWIRGDGEYQMIDLTQRR